MRHATLAAATLTLVACGAVPNLSVINIGAGILPEYAIDRDYAVGNVPMQNCPDGEQTVTDDRTGQDLTLKITKTATGCRLSFHEPNMLLFSEEDARSANELAPGDQIDSLEEASVIIKAFTLLADGAAYDIEANLTALDVSIDGQSLVTRADILALENGAVKKSVDGELLDKLKTGVTSGTEVRADVWALLELNDAAFQNVPGVFTVRATLQPSVAVNVVKAAGG